MATYLEFRNSGDIVTLTIEVVWVEGLDSLQHLVVLLIHELMVSTSAVPWVEGVVTDDGESLLGQRRLVLDDVVQILIVTPREHHVVKTTARAVDSELGAVDLVVVIGILLEGLGTVDDSVVESKADGEGVADNVPLALSIEEEEQLSQIMDQTGQLHPSGLAIASDSLCRLEQVVNLRERGVGVRLVDQGVQPLHSFPDAHLRASLGVELVASLEVVGDSLLGVLLLVEVLHAVTGVLVLAELGLVLALIEFRFIIESLLFLLFLQVALQNIDLVNVVRQALQGQSITILLERSDRSLSNGGFRDCSGGHCD